MLINQLSTASSSWSYTYSVSVSVPVSSSPSAVIARSQAVFGNLQAVVRQSSGSRQAVIWQSLGSHQERAYFAVVLQKMFLNLPYSRSLEKVCLALLFFNLRSYHSASISVELTQSILLRSTHYGSCVNT